jgi:uncharacterized damage-inducible protein DinB
MTVNDLQRRYDYGYWANTKLFAVIAQLTPEQFTQDVAGSYGSIRNTMVHTLSAEWGWLERCGGHPRGPTLNAEDFPTAQSLVNRWTEIEGHVRDFLSHLTDDDLARVVEFDLPPGQKRAMAVSEMMEHAANHAVHHRGQVALLLRVLGRAPGNFDLLFYDTEKRSGSAW